MLLLGGKKDSMVGILILNSITIHNDNYKLELCVVILGVGCSCLSVCKEEGWLVILSNAMIDMLSCATSK